MREAEAHGEGGVARAIGPVNRWQEEMAERQRLEFLGIDAVLRKHQLQLVAGSERRRGAGLGADADPVEPARRRAGAVGLDGDGEAFGMERVDQDRVELQQRLAAGADDEGPRPRLGGPGAAHRGSEVERSGEAPAAGPVSADEIGVAEAARRGGAIGLAAAPEIAAGEAAEHGGAAGICALALERVEDLLDRVAHPPLPSRKPW